MPPVGGKSDYRGSRGGMQARANPDGQQPDALRQDPDRSPSAQGGAVKPRGARRTSRQGADAFVMAREAMRVTRNRRPALRSIAGGRQKGRGLRSLI